MRRLDTAGNQRSSGTPARDAEQSRRQPVPPFYDGVFREDDYKSTEFILPDPYFISRAKPLVGDLFTMGPNDILGFRNRAVPNFADIITIGDSQTYGNNVPLDYNWPSRLKAHLSSDLRPTIYNMSCGGWDGIQYFEIMKKALYLQPRVVVVAFYTGNDPVGAFEAVYGAAHWNDFKVDPRLTKEDAPAVAFPAPPSETWPVRFKDGTATVFTPTLRLASNLPDNPAVQAGWAILKEVARRITGLSKGAGLSVVFAIIPTKELVYAPRIAAEGIEAPEDFRRLVSAEPHDIAELATAIRQLPGVAYVDVVGPLQTAAARALIYPNNENGHPLEVGYDVIAAAIAPAIESHLPALPKGLVFVDYPDGASVPILARGDSLMIFTSREIAVGNGWPAQPEKHMRPRDTAGMRSIGFISTIQPDLFGPSAQSTPGPVSNAAPGAS